MSSYRKYTPWTKTDIKSYSSSSLKSTDSLPTTKKYESSYSRTKIEPQATKDSGKSTPATDKSTVSSRYATGSSYRSTYSPSTTSYSRDKSNVRDKDVLSYSTEDKSEKQSVLNKYMSTKIDKKLDTLSPTSYSRLGVNGTTRPKSREPSPVDKSYSYSKPNSISRDKSPAGNKSSNAKDSAYETEKNIPNKTTKTPGFSTSSYPSYKLYPRSTTYSRSTIKEEPKASCATNSRYNPNTNKFESTYSRTPSNDKISTLQPSPSLSAASSTSSLHLKSAMQSSETAKENGNGFERSELKEDENESDSEEESSESEAQSMIFVTVVTRGTSPTAPCSSVYLRTRRADMAKTIEKTISRPKKPLEMVDKEMQSDRLDDTTRSSRYAGSTRGWSSYLDTRYTSPVSTRSYSSGISRYNNYSSTTSSTSENSSSVSESNKKPESKVTTNITSSVHISPVISPPVTSVAVISSAVNTASVVSPSCNISAMVSLPTASSPNVSSAVIFKPISSSPTVSSPASFSPAVTSRVISPPATTSPGLRLPSPSYISTPAVSKNPDKNTSEALLDSSGSISKPIITNGTAYLPKSMSPKSPPPTYGLEDKHRTSPIQSNRSIPVKDKSKSKSPPLSQTKSKNQSPIENCNSQLPPQVPKADSSSPVKTTSATGKKNKTGTKKIVKKIRSKDGEPKKRLVRRSVSSSSADSESSLQSGGSESTQENSEKVKKTKAESGTKSESSNNSNSDNSNRNSKSRSVLSSRASSIESNSILSSSSSTEDELDQSKINGGSLTLHNISKKDVSSRTSVLASSADEISFSIDKPVRSSPSPKSQKNDSQPKTEEAKSFLMRALAPVTCLFKMRSQESDKGHWLDSASESDKQNTLNGLSLATDTESKSSNKKPHVIRHIQSGEKAWWMESDKSNCENQSNKNSSPPKASDSTASKSVEDNNTKENGGFKFRIIKQDSGEKPWWLESNANIPEGIEVKTPSRKGSSDDSEHSEKFNVYKLRHFDSGEKDWWLKSSDKSTDNDKSHKSSDKQVNGNENFTLNVVKIRHIESGEKAWWMSGNANKPEGKHDTTSTSDSESSDVGHKPVENNGMHSNVTNGYTESVPRFPVTVPDEEDEEPLGDRRSPEGLEAPSTVNEFFGRRSPYDNVRCNHTCQNHNIGRRVPCSYYISRHMDIDDILGTSGQLLGSMEDEILSTKTSREIVEGDNSECKEVNPAQVRIHDSTAQRPVIQKLLSRSDIIDCRNENNSLELEDCALQMKKDDQFGSYLDLDLSLSEQQDDIEGFNRTENNSIVLRTQLTVRVKVIIEKLLTSKGQELRSALFSLKQIFQGDKDLVHEFVQSGGLDCFIKVSENVDQNYLNYILRALGQVILYVDGMTGLMNHPPCLQWLYSLVGTKFTLVVKTALKLLLVFVEFTEFNSVILVKAIQAYDNKENLPPWSNILSLLKDQDSVDSKVTVHAMNLINKCLNGIPDQPTYFNITDVLHKQGLYSIIQKSMKSDINPDLLRQFQIYEAMLSHEKGECRENALRQLDDTIRRTLRSAIPEDSKPSPCLYEVPEGGTCCQGRHHDDEDEANSNNLRDSQGNQMYTSSLQNRILSGSFANATAKDVANELLNGKTLDETDNAKCDGALKKPMVTINKESTVKDLTQKLCSPPILKPQMEEIKLNLVGEMTGIISKAMEGLEKSKKKPIFRSPALELTPKEDVAKRGDDFCWEDIVASLDRPLVINDLDFQDLTDDEDREANPTSGNGHAPPPPPLLPGRLLPPPPPSFPVPQISTDSTEENTKMKKTIKLFWREIVEIPRRKCETSLWDEITPVELDTKSLEHLFEYKSSKETLKDQFESKTKELIVLDAKRSNAINILLKKLPAHDAIKNAILKMDSLVLTREALDKLQGMLPTNEETEKIREAQMANPSVPLGNAEQFLLTLSSMTDVHARIKLWTFKLDFETLEKEIADPLMDLKIAINIIKSNKTFKNIISTVLTIGVFLNGIETKGFHIEYLSKLHEVKDTVYKHSLLHHTVSIMLDKFPDISDLYSEIGPVTRASKVDYEELSVTLGRMEVDCKAANHYMKQIIVNDPNFAKAKIGDFLQDCAERIILLGIIRKRLFQRFMKFKMWLGVSSDMKISQTFKIISEFALEFRTTREKVLEQNLRKLNHRERSKTRGKLICDMSASTESPDHQLKKLLSSKDVDSPSSQAGRKRKDRMDKSHVVDEEDSIEDAFTTLLTSKKPHERKHDSASKRHSHVQKSSIKRSRTREAVYKEA